MVKFRPKMAMFVALNVGLGVAVPASADSTDGKPVKYPAYHRVQQGESMWAIAHDFLVRATGHEPLNLVTSHEVQQMRRLNRDTLHSSDRIYAGQRLLLAPTNWDVPDGKDGWGTGFTSCANERPDMRARAPHAGLTLHTRLLKRPANRRYEPVRLVMHNNSDRTRRFSTQLEHGLLVPSDGSATAVVRTDTIGVSAWKLRPGETRHVDGRVAAFVCGDTSYLDRPLGAGKYKLYGIAVWYASNRVTREWVSSARQVRVVRS